jgi:dihydrofolate reductase
VITIVAAVARNGVIGRDNAIPWRIPEDLAHFRALTLGHAVVMGRRTWDSLPDRFRPLPGRRNVVLTRNTEWRAAGAEWAGSLEEAIDLVRDEQRVFVIGGAQIYAAALSLADELELTEIDLEVEGDALFPSFESDEFEEIAREPHVSSDGVAFAFTTYERRRGRATSEHAGPADGTSTM